VIVLLRPRGWFVIEIALLRSYTNPSFLPFVFVVFDFLLHYTSLSAESKTTEKHRNEEHGRNKKQKNGIIEE